MGLRIKNYVASLKNPIFGGSQKNNIEGGGSVDIPMYTMKLDTLLHRGPKAQHLYINDIIK